MAPEIAVPAVVRILQKFFMTSLPSSSSSTLRMIRRWSVSAWLSPSMRMSKVLLVWYWSMSADLPATRRRKLLVQVHYVSRRAEEVQRRKKLGRWDESADEGFWLTFTSRAGSKFTARISYSVSFMLHGIRLRWKYLQRLDDTVAFQVT